MPNKAYLNILYLLNTKKIRKNYPESQKINSFEAESRQKM